MTISNVSMMYNFGVRIKNSFDNSKGKTFQLSHVSSRAKLNYNFLAKSLRSLRLCG